MEALNFVNLIVGIIGFPLGAIGLILTVYYARKAEQTEIELKRISGLRKRLDWSEIQMAASDLEKAVSAAGIIPTLIFSPGLSGATFANLFEKALEVRTTVYVGICYWKASDSNFSEPKDADQNYIRLETTKWVVLVPRIAEWKENDQILILDDFVMSGDFLTSFRKALVESGIQDDRIHSAAIVTTHVAKQSKKGPDFSWFVSDDDNFYFPWGKAR